MTPEQPVLNNIADKLLFLVWIDPYYKQKYLFKFIHDKLEIKGTKIILSRSSEDANKVLRKLKHDFDKYSSQIKAMLKTYRSNAHYISIY